MWDMVGAKPFEVLRSPALSNRLRTVRTSHFHDDFLARGPTYDPSTLNIRSSDALIPEEDSIIFDNCCRGICRGTCRGNLQWCILSRGCICASDMPNCFPCKSSISRGSFKVLQARNSRRSQLALVVNSSCYQVHRLKFCFSPAIRWKSSGSSNVLSLTAKTQSPAIYSRTERFMEFSRIGIESSQRYVAARRTNTV